VCSSDLRDESYYAGIAAALASGPEVGRVYRMLLDRDVAHFHPFKAAPDPNGSKQAMLADTLTGTSQWVYQQCQPGGGFAGRSYLTIAEVEATCGALARNLPPGTVNSRTVRDGLRAVGCKALGQIQAAQDRLRLWSGPAMDPAFRDGGFKTVPEKDLMAAYRAEEAAQKAAATAQLFAAPPTF